MAVEFHYGDSFSKFINRLNIGFKSEIFTSKLISGDILSLVRNQKEQQTNPDKKKIYKTQKPHKGIEKQRISFNRKMPTVTFSICL